MPRRDFEDEVSVAKTIQHNAPSTFATRPRPLRNMADVDEEEAANSSSAAVVGKTSAYHCTCAGRGLHVATVRALNTFSIQACDAEQQQRTSGGDTFFVSIRGNSKVRARVRDQGDGTYVVEYMPSVSGFYTISISIFGEPLRESPFDLAVINTSPDPVKCECRGDALTTAVARQNHTPRCDIAMRSAMSRMQRSWTSMSRLYRLQIAAMMQRQQHHLSQQRQQFLAGRHPHPRQHQH